SSLTLLLVLSVLSRLYLPANLSGRGPLAVNIDVSRSFAQGLDDLVKVGARRDALTVWPHNVRGGNAAADGTGSRVGTGWRIGEPSRRSTGGAGGRTAQEHHDAGR